MFAVRAKLPTWWRMLAVALLSGLAGYALRSAAGSAAKPPDSIPALVAHLQQHGIPLRVIPMVRDGDICLGAFLTRTSKDWEQLSGQPRAPQQLPHWKGTFHVMPEHNAQVRAEMLATCKGGCLLYGQLLLFGDPGLLEEIRAALGK